MMRVGIAYIVYTFLTGIDLAHTIMTMHPEPNAGRGIELADTVYFGASFSYGAEVLPPSGGTPR